MAAVGGIYLSTILLTLEAHLDLPTHHRCVLAQSRSRTFHRYSFRLGPWNCIFRKSPHKNVSRNSLYLPYIYIYEPWRNIGKSMRNTLYILGYQGRSTRLGTYQGTLASHFACKFYYDSAKSYLIMFTH